MIVNNDQVIGTVEAGHEKFGRIDVVVNNAGYANTTSVEDIDIADFRAQVDANFFGVVHVTKAVLPILHQQGSGHIFQVSSLGGRLGTPGLCAYQSAKWAVGGFSTVLAQEVMPLGIKVTILEPSGIQTDWAGLSMHIPAVSKPYKPTVGAFSKILWKMSGTELSLPSKIAGIVLKLLKEKMPLLCILIRPDAVEYAGKEAEALAVFDVQWCRLSLASS